MIDKKGNVLYTVTRKNKFSIKERNSTLRKNTHDKGRLLRDEGGALIYYSTPLFRDHFAIFRVTVHTLVGNYFYNIILTLLIK